MSAVRFFCGVHGGDTELDADMFDWWLRFVNDVCLIPDRYSLTSSAALPCMPVGPVFDFIDIKLPAAHCLHSQCVHVRNRKIPVSANGFTSCSHVALLSCVLGRPCVRPDNCLTSVQLVVEGPPIPFSLTAAVLS